MSKPKRTDDQRAAEVEALAAKLAEAVTAALSNPSDPRVAWVDVATYVGHPASGAAAGRTRARWLMLVLSGISACRPPSSRQRRRGRCAARGDLGRGRSAGMGRQVIEDTASGNSMRRPGLTEALARLREGDVLMVAKMDRLSRSLLDFASMMQAAEREGGPSSVSTGRPTP
jgi:hypothetical protein